MSRSHCNYRNCRKLAVYGLDVKPIMCVKHSKLFRGMKHWRLFLRCIHDSGCLNKPTYFRPGAEFPEYCYSHRTEDSKYKRYHICECGNLGRKRLDPHERQWYCDTCYRLKSKIPESPVAVPELIKDWTDSETEDDQIAMAKIRSISELRASELTDEEQVTPMELPAHLESVIDEEPSDELPEGWIDLNAP